MKPALFRRDDVPHRRWVAFAYDYGDKRQIGFVTYAALELISERAGSPAELFDAEAGKVLSCAVTKVERGSLTPEGHALLVPDDFGDEPLSANAD